MAKLITTLLSIVKNVNRFKAEMLKSKKTENMNDNKRKTLVESVALQMCKTENRLSTRKLKLEMRNQYPSEMWNQYHDGKNKGVTGYFHELVHEGKFVSIADNGTYQTYAATSLPIVSRKGDTYIPDAERETLPTPKTATVNKLAKALGKSKPVATTKTASKAVKVTATKPTVTKTVKSTAKSISRTKAAELLTTTAGKFCSGTFIKKDSTQRDMNFRVMKGTKPSALGYMQVVDIQLYNKARSAGKDKTEAQKASTRNINLQTLKMLKVNNVTNIVK